MADGPFPPELPAWCREHRWWLILVLPIILIVYFLFPFVDGIVLGMVFAYVGRPIRDLFGRRRRLGSLAATLAIVIPIFLILGLGMLELANQVIWLARNPGEVMGTFGSLIGRLQVPPVVNEAITGGLQNILAIATPIVTAVPVITIGRAITLGVANFVISLPVCYFLLLDGERFVDSIIALMPAERVQTYRRYISRIDSILSGIFLGSIYTSIVGSLIASVVFYAFGVARPFALASFVFIAGMVPLLTAWIIIIPVTIYRYLNMGVPDALLFLAVASVLIYLPSELVIRPYLVSYRSSMHPLLVMLTFFGGALVAGIGGFFLAPAIMGVITGIYQVRREELAICEVEARGSA